MKELAYLNAFLGCATGRCLVGGEKVILRKTSKGHLVMDFVEHIFLKGEAESGTTSAMLTSQSPKPRKTLWKWVPKTTGFKKMVKFGNRELFHYLLEFEEGNQCECCLSVVNPDCHHAEHLQLTLEELEPPA